MGLWLLPFPSHRNRSRVAGGVHEHRRNEALLEGGQLKFGRGRLQQRIGEGVTSSTSVGDVVEVVLWADESKTIRGQLLKVEPQEIVLKVGEAEQHLNVSDIKSINALAPQG